jgi:hypothetical protein
MTVDDGQYGQLRNQEIESGFNQTLIFSFFSVPLCLRG